MFTSLKDDTVGGDTNGDGETTAPARGDWYGIDAFKRSSLLLDHVDIRYGTRVSSEYSPRSFALLNSVLAHGVRVQAENYDDTELGAMARLEIRGNSLVDVGPVEYAVDVAGWGSLSPIVADNTISGVQWYGVSNPVPYGGRAITVTGNNLNAANLTGNTGSSNTTSFMVVNGTLTSDATLPVPG